MAPSIEIRFLRVATGGIAGEARGNDQLGSGAQQLEARLITDLNASAGEQRHATAQISQFGSLVEIERRARRAHLIVEMVDGRELLFANVAMLRIHFSGVRVLVEIRGRKDSGAREYRLPSKRPN